MKNGAITLIFSAVALGVAVFAMTKEPEARPQRASGDTERIAALEQKVEKLSLELNYVKSGKPRPIRRGESVIPSPSYSPEAGAPRTAMDDVTNASEGGEGDSALAAIVDDAVDRKTKQVLEDMRIKANKKPAIDVFAKTLELSKDQRAATERIVADGQRKVHELLNIPTQNGTNLMEELVEIAARGIAQPGKDHGWGKWIGRIMSEKVPGTDMTYAAQLESVKKSMRTDFKREWTEAQYREFEEWKVDPTEIEKVADSPNVALFERITERARQLGATLPENK